MSKDKFQKKMVSKLAVVDGLSITTISKKWIYQGKFLKYRTTVAKSPSSVMALIHNYYSKTELHNEKFGAIKCENKKMSICIDERTSCRNWRYMNIHTQNYWVNLQGMYPVVSLLNCHNTVAIWLLTGPDIEIQKIQEPTSKNLENNSAQHCTNGF
jgi:hypothetical protein